MMSSDSRPGDSAAADAETEEDKGPGDPQSGEGEDDKDNKVSDKVPQAATQAGKGVEKGSSSDESARSGSMSEILTSASLHVPSEKPSESDCQSQGSGSNHSEILKWLVKTPEGSPVPGALPAGPCSLCRLIGSCRGCNMPFFAYHASKEDDEHLLDCDLGYPDTPPNSSWHRGDPPAVENSQDSEYSEASSNSRAKRAKRGDPSG